MKSVVFSQPWGGLGDNLGFTNLPELYFESGISFYISRLNYTRNKDIYDLCWAHNEYVKKLKRTIPNIGYKTLFELDYKCFDKKYNIVQNINVAHGFKPGYGYPKIKLQSYLKNSSNEHFDRVIDFQAHSIFNDSHFSYDEESFKEKTNYYSTPHSISLVYPNIYQINKKNNNSIEVTSIKRLISILLNTNTFVCLNSGSHVLAATLNNKTGFPKNIISFNNVRDVNVKINNHRIHNKYAQYYFDNVNYEKINIVKKNTDKSEHKDLQEITKNMSKSYKYHRRVFYYQKRINRILGI